MVGDHPVDGGLPSMAVVTWFNFVPNFKSVGGWVTSLEMVVDRSGGGG